MGCCEQPRRACHPLRTQGPNSQPRWAWLSPPQGKADVKACQGGCPLSATSQTPAGSAGIMREEGRCNGRNFPSLLRVIFSLCSGKGRWVLVGLREGGASGLAAGSSTPAPWAVAISSRKTFLKAKQSHIARRRRRERVAGSVLEWLLPLGWVPPGLPLSIHQLSLLFIPLSAAKPGFILTFLLPLGSLPCHHPSLRRIPAGRAELQSSLHPFPRCTPRSHSALAALVPPPLCSGSPHGATDKTPALWAARREQKPPALLLLPL